jgi:RNA polymerase sigma factor (sigma-70 family)
MAGETKEAGRALDAYLAAAARTGDRKAMALLFKRWNPRLTVHAWRLLGDRELAADAVQEGWVEIVRSLTRLDDVAAFGTWAYRITSRRCARAIGRAVRDRRITEALSVEEAAEPAIEPEGLRLRAAIDALPPDQRAAIALFYLEDMGVAEVAVALAVPAGTVKTRLMHARQKLRAALEGDE